MTRKPTTLHEHFRTDPRGADSFGKWIEDRIWELLQRTARMDFVDGEGQPWRAFVSTVVANRKAFELATSGLIQRRGSLKLRIVLLDGTIIKEWLPETKDSATVEKT
jgi:hypothetical protein